MIAGTLEIQLMADMARLAPDIHSAKRVIGDGMSAAWEKAKEAFDKFKEWMKTQLVIWGAAAAIGISAAVLGVVYAVFKAISFGIGLLTGESYKSTNIDALVAMNKEVKTLQENLPLTAVGASALNEALKAQGTSASEYAQTLGKVASAARANGEELGRLGVQYKDQNGNLLSTQETLENAAVVLATYTEGWDREQAAAAMAMGSEKQIQAALAVTAEKVQIAKERLIDYGLVIGPGTQQQVARYEEAMRAFQRESDLTAQGFKRAIADNIMPVLTDFAEFFRDGFPTVVMAFRYSMATLTSLFYGLRTAVYIVAEAIVGSLSAVGSVLGGLGKGLWKAMQGDFKGATAELVRGWEEAKMRLGQIGDNIVEQARHNRDAMLQAWGADSLGDLGADATAKAGKVWTPPPKEVDDSAYRSLLKTLKEKLVVDQELTEVSRLQLALDALGAKQRATITAAREAELRVLAQRVDLLKQEQKYRDIAKPIVERTAQLQAEYLGQEKLSESQQLALKLMVALREGTLKLSDAAKIKLVVALEEMLAADKQLKQRQAQLAADKSYYEFLQAQTARREQADAVLSDFVITQAKLLENLRAEIELAGIDSQLAGAGLLEKEDELRLASQVNLQRETAIALRRLENEFQIASVQLEGQAYETAVKKYDLMREALPALLAEREALKLNQALSKNSIDEFNTLWSTVESTGKQVFLNLFADGKSAFEGIGKALKASVIDLLYQLTARKWIIQIGTGVAGSLGIGTAAQAAGGAMGGGMMSGLGSWAGAGLSALGGSIASGILPGALSIGEALGGLWATGTAASGFAGGGMAGLGAGMSAALGAMGPVGWAALASGALLGANALGLFGDDGPSNPAPQIGLFGPGELQDYQAAAEYNDKFKLGGGFYGADALQKLDAANAILNDPTKYNQDVLATLTRSAGGMMLTGEQGETTAQMIARMVQYLEPARVAAEQELKAIAELDQQRRGLEIKLMEAQGDAAGALAAQREDELNAMDAALRPLQELINATEDWVEKLSAAQSAALDAVSALLQASEAAANTARQTAARFRELGASLLETIRELRGGDLSTLNPLAKLGESRANLDAVFQRALSGDAAALSALPSMATDFLQASRDYNASSEAYAQDFQRVMTLLDQANQASVATAGRADYQTTLLDIQTAILTQIRDELQKPDPNTAFIAEQTALLGGLQGLIADQTSQGSSAQDAIRDILALNTGVTEQTLNALLDGSVRDSGGFGGLIAKGAETISLLQRLVNLNEQQLAAAKQAQIEQERQQQVAQLSAAYDTAKAASDAARAVRDAAVTNLGAEQTAGFTNEDITQGRAGGYDYYTYWVGQEALADAAIAANVQYMELFARAYEAWRAIPGHAVGLDYVPYDDYLMRAHQGEAVLSAREASAWRSGQAPITGADLGELAEAQGRQNELAAESLVAQGESSRSLAAIRADMRELKAAFQALSAELRRVSAK